MLRQIIPVPRECAVACSGGPDSMAVLDFLRRSNKVKAVLYYDHKTPQSSDFYQSVKSYCDQYGLQIVTGELESKVPQGASKEAFWSNKRNRFFNQSNLPVVTGHTLDDAVEWWIFTSLKGCGRIMPTKNENVLRPFLSTKKIDLLKWNKDHNVSFCVDSSNTDTSYMRNFIRHEMMSDCLKVNPGLYKTILKKIMERQNALKSR